MSNTSTYLSPEEIAAFQNRRNYANTAADRSVAYLRYQKQVADNNYANNRNRIDTSWNQNWYNQQGGFGRRGIFNSGIYTGAGTNWRQQRDNAMQDYARQYQNQLGDYAQQESNVEAIRNSTLAGVDNEQQASQAMKAALIRGA